MAHAVTRNQIVQADHVLDGRGSDIASLVKAAWNAAWPVGSHKALNSSADQPVQDGSQCAPAEAAVGAQSTHDAFWQTLAGSANASQAVHNVSGHAPAVSVHDGVAVHAGVHHSPAVPTSDAPEVVATAAQQPKRQELPSGASDRSSLVAAEAAGRRDFSGVREAAMGSKRGTSPVADVHISSGLWHTCVPQTLDLEEREGVSEWARGVGYARRYLLKPSQEFWKQHKNSFQAAKTVCALCVSLSPA
jgi:hypothetical protein